MNLVQIEKEILQFWQENKIFQKLKDKQRRSKNKFIFFEGPPTANGLPHIGHFLTRAFKDIILRFYDLLGYQVFRRAGWDTHGLPVEVEVEKELKIKNKKEIENLGIENFIQKCKESVWRYKREWEIYTERMGFWLDMEKPYITYDPFYIETLWKIIKKWYQQKILVKDKRVIPYCPRCGTALSNHELNQPDAYRPIADPSVYIQVPLKNKKEYFLFWTTTPWTVLANVGLALNPNFEYGLFKKDEFYWVEYSLGKNLFNQEPIKKIKGQKLINLAYFQPFAEILPKFPRKTFPGAFVSSTEGTGFVHLAPAYGQDDYELGKKYNLPIIEYINDEGKFDFSFSKIEINYNEFLRQIDGLYFKDADKFIFEELQKRGFLFQGSLTGIVHDYPHCWRCKNPLIYKLDQTWIVKVSKFKNKILQANSKINWVPDFIKEGRMGEWLKEGKDWNFSRKRYWGTPLPIWICQKCNREKVIDSILEISQPAKNNYIFLRHGEALSNKKNILSSLPEYFENRLTLKGRQDIQKIAKRLAGKIDLIVASPLLRTKETAEIISKILNIPVEYDLRLQEVNFGQLNNHSVKLYHQFIDFDPLNQFYRAPLDGENLTQVAKRAYSVLLDLERKYNNKNILIVTHSDVIWSVMVYALGLSPEKVAYNKKYHLKPGEFLKVKPYLVPLNSENELDLHRQVIDKITFDCKCGGKMIRTSEVVDVWFDSGAMPFGQALSLKPQQFPADYICEGIDQTRGWFYTLIVVSTLLNKKPPFKNVLVLGHVLDKEGKKMSKSLGNVVSPMEMMEKYGADVLRLYFYSINSPWENKKFNEDDLKEILNQFFILLANIFNFYELYRQPKKKKTKSWHILDKWFETRFKKLNFEVTTDLQNFQITEASRKMINFLDDFSRWWLRLSRERFKQESQPTLIFERIFTNYLILLAPFCPFVSEYYWQKIRRINKKLPLSVHLASWPKVKKLTLIEKNLLADMELTKEITSKILSARKLLNIKIRQPLLKVIVAHQPLKRQFQEIILQETNFLNIEFADKLPDQPNYFKYENIAIDTTLDDNLLKLGLLREIKRAIQDLRKQEGLNPSDKASIAILSYSQKDIKFLEKELKKIKQTKIILTHHEPQQFLKLKELNLPHWGKIILYLL